MNFFDGLLSNVIDCLDSFEKRHFTSGKGWEDIGSNEVILQRDTSFELDGVGFNIVTSKPLGDSEVVVIGNDLNEIKSSTRFARISIIEMDDIADEQQAYNVIRKVEYAKYHYYPKGFMVRTASENHRENVRVSKTAIKNGLTFEGVGNILIGKYKENDAVRSVKLVYVTDSGVDYDELERIAKKNYAITETLNHIMNNINYDCSACSLKPICDEVEGMKELHFKNSGM